MKRKQIDLKRFRTDKNLTQVDLAILLDCKQNFISDIENGRKSLPADKFELLKERYGDITAYIAESSPADIKRADKTVSTVESLQREVALLKEQLSEEKNRSEKYLNMIQSLINK